MLIWAKTGQNWQKSAIREMQNLQNLVHHFIGIEISWEPAEKIIKIRPTVAISPL